MMITHWTVSTFTLCHVVLLYMVSRIACDCPTPPVYEDKTHSNYGSSYITGARATYQCAPGYINPSGQTISTCQSDGTWTQVALQCERGSCSNPGTPYKGTRSGDDFRVSEQVNFSCDEGYRLIGDTISTCMVDQTWSNSIPTCVAITCAGLQAPQHGSISRPGEARYNDVITITCNRGRMYSEQSNTRRCTENGWTGNEGTCKETDCGLPSLSNGTVEAPMGTGYAAEIRYRCHHGTIRDESQALKDSGGYSRCHDTGLWVPEPPTCNLPCSRDVPAVTHGSIDATSPSYPHNTELNIKCNPGYTHEGPEKVVCRNGRWTPSVDITCEQVPTPKPTTAPVHTEAPDTSTVTPPTTKNIPGTHPSTTVQDQTVTPVPDGHKGLLKEWCIALGCFAACIFSGMFHCSCCHRKRNHIRREAYLQETKFDALCLEVDGIIDSLPETYNQKEAKAEAEKAKAKATTKAKADALLAEQARRREAEAARRAEEEVQRLKKVREDKSKMETLKKDASIFTSSCVKSYFEKLGPLIKSVVLIDKKQNENIASAFVEDIDNLKDGDEKDEDYIYWLIIRLIIDDLKWVREEDCTAYMDGRNRAWQEKKRDIEGNLQDRDQNDQMRNMQVVMQYFLAMERVHNALEQYVKDYHPRGLIYDDPALTTWMGRYCKLGLFPCCDYTATIKRKPEETRSEDIKLLPIPV